MRGTKRKKRKRHQQLALFVGQAPGPNSQRAAAATLRRPATAAVQPPQPLGGAAGTRLARLAGVAAPDLWNVCHRRNLIAKYPGKKTLSKIKLRHRHREGRDYLLHQSSGDHFPLQQARDNAARMDVAPYALVVLLGLNVARAFHLADVKLFKRYRWEPERGKKATPLPPSANEFNGQTILLIFPHPSGVSHYWNTIQNRRRAQQELRRALIDTGVLEHRGSPYFLRNRSSVYFAPAVILYRPVSPAEKIPVVDAAAGDDNDHTAVAALLGTVPLSYQSKND